MLNTIRQFQQDNASAFPSEQAVYAAIRTGKIPAGVCVRLGRKLMINSARWQDFIEAGGAALAGGWRREAA